MAGLWEIVSRAGGLEEDRMNNHLFDAAFVLTGTGDITNSAAKTALETELGRSFTVDETTDLTAIQAALDGQPNITAKLVYIQKISAAAIAAEVNSIGETKWREILGIGTP
jgi:hypothetical protein